MEYEKMTTQDLLDRRTAIAGEADQDGADLDALEAEVRAINAELERRKAAEAKRREIRAAVAAGRGETIDRMPTPTEGRAKSPAEVRATPEYAAAYASYIKTGDDAECRALLTKNSNIDGNPGQLPVPVIVEETIRTAWERTALMDKVRKTYVRGNLQIGFELSATGASVHEEGDDAPDEEALTLGVVTLIAKSIKKWIRVSDETLDLGGEEFLRYIYSELAYRIAKEARAILLGKIADAGTSSTSTAIGVPEVTGAPTLDVVSKAIANLGDDAADIDVVMNRLTHADFIAAIAANGYMFDPFEGVTVHYDSTLPAYADASEDDVWMIVGDFDGAQMNLPNGEEIRIKFDDLTEAEADLVKIVGRMFAAIEITQPGAFVKVVKGAAAAGGSDGEG